MSETIVTCRVFVRRHYIACEFFDITTTSTTKGRALHRAQKLAIKAANKLIPDARATAIDNGWLKSDPVVEIERIGYPNHTRENMTEILPGVFHPERRTAAVTTEPRYHWRNHTYRSLAGLTRAVTRHIADALDDRQITCGVTVEPGGKNGAGWMRVEARKGEQIVQKLSYATVADVDGNPIISAFPTWP